MNQTSTQKFRRQVVYNSKKEIKQDFNLSSLILNKYTSIVQFKNGLDDKKQTVYISMFSKNLIQRINQENYLTFFCDATFKLAMNLQVMILKTCLQIPIVDMTKEPKELEYEFVPFAILLTNRKTQVIYEKWFQELKEYGLLITPQKTLMSDFELAIPHAAKKVFPHLKWNFCWFHVKHNVYEKLTELKLNYPLKKSISDQITRIHECENDIQKALDIWNNYKKILQKSSNAEVRKGTTSFCTYFDQYYIPKISQWILKTDESGRKMVTTNNVLERFNLTLKKVITHDTANLPVNTIVDKLNILFGILENQFPINLGQPKIDNFNNDNNDNDFIDQITNVPSPIIIPSTPPLISTPQHQQLKPLTPPLIQPTPLPVTPPLSTLQIPSFLSISSPTTLQNTPLSPQHIQSHLTENIPQFSLSLSLSSSLSPLLLSPQSPNTNNSNSIEIEDQSLSLLKGLHSHITNLKTSLPPKKSKKKDRNFMEPPHQNQNQKEHEKLKFSQ